MLRNSCIVLFLASVTLNSCNSYDDTAVKDELASLNQRITQLEILCNQLNTNISSLNTIAGVLQHNTYVIGVGNLVDGTGSIGSVIRLSDGSSISIYHGHDGSDGKDGNTPNIGIGLYNGDYYWTLNGEWLRDSNGMMIPASGNNGQDAKDGVTPKLKIEDGFWFISYDYGKTWSKIGKATGEDGRSFFSNVSEDEKYVYLTLVDGSTITLPKATPFALEFDSDVYFANERTLDIPFEIIGAESDFDIMTITDSRLSAEAVVYKLNEGLLKVTFADDNLTGNLMVVATSGDRSFIKNLSFEKSEMRTDRSSLVVGCDGGEFTIRLTRNQEVDITPNVSWISHVSTKTVIETLTFAVEKNSAYSSRQGVVKITGKGGSPFINVIVKQEAQPFLSVDKSSYTYDFLKGGSVTFNVEASSDWRIESDGQEWISLSQTSGEEGKYAVTATAVEANSGRNSSRSTTLKVTCGGLSKSVTLTQISAFELDSKTISIPSSASTIKISFTFNREYTSGLSIPTERGAGFDSLFENNMPGYFNSQSHGVSGDDSVATTTAAVNSSLTLTLNNKTTANFSSSPRSGLIRMSYTESGQTVYSDWITITQAGCSESFSSDYSMDGKVKVLQMHKKGNGIPIVLMGDGYSDKDIQSGKYDDHMNEAFKYCFDIEPYLTFKDYFDVYQVTAVSPSGKIDGYTRFACSFGDGTEITGDNNTCLQYAALAVPSSRKNDMLVCIMLNSTKRSGTTSITSLTGNRDIPEGYSIAYTPMCPYTSSSSDSFKEIFHHEALGHGFGKLADEYYYSGTITDYGKQTVLQWQGYGCYRNVSIYPSVTQTYWSTFAADSRYAAEKLGVYEGAYTIRYGVYRPTDDSIMRNNFGEFNAPSREAIYKRIMHIADKSWTYDYETFVSIDSNRLKPSNASSQMSARSISVMNPPLAAPHLIIINE